jgi:demethylmenaquinone methyltransferase/2-methoxy-6-polyprenyl-1,4-benzoquinol methylase
MFASISGTYDALNHVLSAGMDRRWRRTLAEAACRGAVRRVLDVGTGTGDLALEILRRADFAGEVVGIDFAAPMLARAREKARGLDRLRLVQADALALPFRDASFDAAMAAFAIRNFADLPRALAEVRRVLRPSGRFFVLEFFRVERRAWPLRVYLGSVLPRLGACVSGHRSAYAYLRDSQEAFLSLDAARSRFEECGFAVAGARRLFPGVADLVVLERSEAGATERGGGPLAAARRMI